jgi:hypothetical protein
MDVVGSSESTDNYDLGHNNSLKICGSHILSSHPMPYLSVGIVKFKQHRIILFNYA